MAHTRQLSRKGFGDLLLIAASVLAPARDLTTVKDNFFGSKSNLFCDYCLPAAMQLNLLTSMKQVTRCVGVGSSKYVDSPAGNAVNELHHWLLIQRNYPSVSRNRKDPFKSYGLIYSHDLYKKIISLDVHPFEGAHSWKLIVLIQNLGSVLPSHIINTEIDENVHGFRNLSQVLAPWIRTNSFIWNCGSGVFAALPHATGASNLRSYIRGDRTPVDESSGKAEFGPFDFVHRHNQTLQG
ncbi:hypothetical protein BDD14_2185 [Edaphobacter modestus]|uniref:Uncharacterized protein n=1 Tax=Edaphobacter modestus TaxID=388466 RepID=A0A4Q7YTV1_9BACT|nr:hypothetical protein BDD14_2185 [Edaphobacter modestus]